MHLIIDEFRPEPESLESAISRREGVLLSIIFHLLVLVAVLLGPRLPWVQALLKESAEARAQAVEEAEKRLAQAPRFVFLTPRIPETPPKPPPDSMLSDSDGEARAPERAERPANELPFSRGNSPDFVDERPAEAPRREADTAPPASPAEPPQRAENETNGATPLELPERERSEPVPQRSDTAPAVKPQARNSPGDVLGRALENLERYVPEETFENPDGGAGRYGQDFDFDRKGVEFGPWIRFFRAQVRSNWLVPEAAAVMKGHVVITLNVWKDGRITDIGVVKPSGVDAFDRAAVNALRWSSPTRPLPPAYPDDRVFFTVTFYYNEWPSSQ
ncbi:MAG: TonB family protein [Luteitalea sp.]|nr:TonB family protein [Luteitalea sp.]